MGSPKTPNQKDAEGGIKGKDLAGGCDICRVGRRPRVESQSVGIEFASYGGFYLCF